MMKTLSRLALGAVMLCAVPASAQQFVIGPKQEVLSGTPVQLRLTGLPPGAEVQVTAERIVDLMGRKLYRSQALFMADGQGRIDLRTAAALSGSYQGVHPRGLFYSMQETKDPAPDWNPEEVRFTAAIAGKPVAASRLVLRESDPAVRVEKIDAFPGAIFASKPGGGRKPVVIVLGGSEGGDYAAKARGPRLAAEGYAVVGLPYYSPGTRGITKIDGLPTDFVDIPVDRLQQVYEWLKGRPDVDADRIGIWGVSKGAEFALIAASHFPWVDAVAAIVPSDVVWEGWGSKVPYGEKSSFSLAGKPLPFVPYKGMDLEFAKLAKGEPFQIRIPHDEGRKAFPDRIEAARIPIERFKGSLLVAGGDRDRLWASGDMARNIAKRRAADGLDTKLLVFPEAGHGLSDDGWGPGFTFSGGTPLANSDAQHQTWHETMNLFNRALKRGRLAQASSR